ncbi:MAG: DNA-processing protein DprA [Verrucomicrobiota bacterium]|nr:DNA-processing protein DprA [Verrucomicrobiota bacterium]MDP7049281.1 DNA-processing protein DprA [Verrucomicrobiota bacterium]
MNTREALVVLNQLEGIGPIRVRQLLEFFGDATKVLQASGPTLTRVKGIGNDLAGTIVQWQSTTDLAGELKRVEAFGARLVFQTDDEYPELLREIYDPPIVLYIKGRLLQEDKNSFAMVGARRTTHYGQDTARKLAYQLAAHGITVVSGGARGIDSASHQGALSGKGRTIAVLGTGINIVYPAENAELYERIIDNGAVITQFPFSRKGDKQSFPIRNRIVAGMTLGTVVVEADLKSGSLITANMAADNNRQVFAVPGRIDSPQSRGCHNLIRNGAALCENAEDILAEFEQLFHSKAIGQADDAEPVPLPNLTDHEQAVLDVLDVTEQSIDTVTANSGLAVSTVSVALLGLEMKRLAKQLPGKLFARR